MAHKIPTHRPSFAPPPGERQAFRQISDRERGSSAARGYGYKWRKARLVFLASNPLCVACARAGITKAAGVVDHITPHRGDPVLRDDVSNWQALCKPCHDSKTFDDMAPARIPVRMPAPAVPVTMVFGPPLSGKSTYVAAHAAQDDVVIDLDVILACITGQPMYAPVGEALMDGLRQRNSMLRSLASRSHGRAWFIVSAPKAEERRKWCALLRPERVVMMHTAMDVSLRRLRQRPRPNQVDYRQLILDWWRDYTPLEGEQMVNGDADKGG